MAVGGEKMACHGLRPFLCGQSTIRQAQRTRTYTSREREKERERGGGGREVALLQEAEMREASHKAERTEEGERD